jgi:urea carboxylase
MSSKFNPVIKRIEARAECPEIVFRRAGDGFVEVVYGSGKASSDKSIKDIILSSMRVIVVNSTVKNTKIKGLIETVPGGESLLYLYDPLEVTEDELVAAISDIEISLETISDRVVETRFIRLPLAFDHTLVKKSIEKYVNEINPTAVNCKDNSNLAYVASYNGMSVDELKKRFLDTEWLVSMVGFFPGLPYFYPLNPAGAITCPKYNPARSWTPEGTVDLADYCATIFGVASSGGYQLIGRTAPIFQANQKHKQYKESPALIRSTDILQFYEVSEEEVDKIFEEVDQGNYEYDIVPRKFSMKEWLAFYDSKEEDAKELRKMQEAGRKATPTL